MEDPRSLWTRAQMQKGRPQHPHKLAPCNGTQPNTIQHSNPLINDLSSTSSSTRGRSRHSATYFSRQNSLHHSQAHQEHHPTGKSAAHCKEMTVLRDASCRHTSWRGVQRSVTACDDVMLDVMLEGGDLICSQGEEEDDLESSAAVLRKLVMPYSEGSDSLANPFSWKELEMSCRKLDAAQIRISLIDLSCMSHADDATDPASLDPAVLYNFHVETGQGSNATSAVPKISRRNSLGSAKSHAANRQPQRAAGLFKNVGQVCKSSSAPSRRKSLDTSTSSSPAASFVSSNKPPRRTSLDSSRALGFPEGSPYSSPCSSGVRHSLSYIASSSCSLSSTSSGELAPVALTRLKSPLSGARGAQEMDSAEAKQRGQRSPLGMAQYQSQESEGLVLVEQTKANKFTLLVKTVRAKCGVLFTSSKSSKCNTPPVKLP